MLRQVMIPLFAVTGFSALCLQVVWQRVISIHGGVDLFSSATVVAAFMAGLGLGSLFGGALADRLGARRSILAFAAANAGIGVFGWVSLWIFYDGYRALVAEIDGLTAAFLFHFALLVIPTTLMGLSLPLLSRGVVREVGEAPSVVSRLYAINTLGAAAGAAIGGWFLLGNLGFEGTVRLASTLNLLAAAAVFLLWRNVPAGPGGAAVPAQARQSSAPGAPVLPGGGAVGTPAGAPAATHAPIWPWLLLYALTGAIALALEVVYFRLVDGIMRSNSYTFAHVLTLYLLLFGAGAALGGKRAQRAVSPDVTFLWIQFWIGAATLLGILALMYAPALFGARTLIENYFGSNGYLLGPTMPRGMISASLFLFAYLIGPGLVMGVPVLLMGYAYPHIAALVLRRDDSLGRHTGALMACNIAGNVVGSLVSGFILLDVLGTAGTLALLAAVLMGLGIVAALRGARARLPRAAAVLLAAVALLAVFPRNEQLWGYLHSAAPEQFALVESRSCATALVEEEDGEQSLHINATSQNPYPYDDFHVLIGLFPALLHPAPERSLAVGLGIGATPYGMLLDPRMRDVEAVEICAGLSDLLRELGNRGSPESHALLDDPRLDLSVGDGRKHLLSAEQPYDLITVDALRPQSGYSGNLYSVEFYELVAERLAPGGLFVQWVPTPRVLASMTEVFPYVATVRGPPDRAAVAQGRSGNSIFAIASNEALAVDRAAAVTRYRALGTAMPMSAEQRASIDYFFTDATFEIERNGEPRSEPTPEERLNRDLRPRDEYFINDR